MSQSISLNLDNVEKLAAIGKALSSDVRIELLKILCHCSLNVNEIAKASETLKSAYKDTLGLTLSEVNKETQVNTRKKRND